MSKIREQESLECGRMHIWALKTQKLPGPTTDCSLCSCELWFTMSVTFSLRSWPPPLDQILDPHLVGQFSSCFSQNPTVSRKRSFSHISFDLTTHLQHFDIRPKMMTKREIWISHEFCHRKILKHALRYATICTLQITNWHWSSITDPSYHK